MFFLHAYTNARTPIILHVRGFSNEHGFGFIHGEGIFEVKMTGDSTFHVVKQVGIVLGEENNLYFSYSDDFKAVIRYKEASGYSSLDGGAWEMMQTSYLDSEGKTSNVVNPRSTIRLMYSSALTPLLNVDNALNEFSALHIMHSEENDETANEAPSTSPKNMSDLINMAGGSPLDPRRGLRSTTPEQESIPQEVQIPNLSPVNQDTHENPDAILERMLARAKLERLSRGPLYSPNSPPMASIPTWVIIPKVKFTFGAPGEESAITPHSP